jgi:hypothetical protein
MYLLRPGALAGRIEVALLDGDLDLAQERLQELDEYVASRDMRDQQPLLMYTRARVAAAAADHESALITLADLAGPVAEAGMRRILLDVHIATAASLDALERTEDATSARTAARELVAQIAADMTDEDLRSAFLEGSDDRLAG